MNEERRLQIEVPDDLDEPSRLDQYLTSELAPQFEHLSRSRIQRLIADGQVTINGKTGKSGVKIHGGEEIHIVVPADVRLEIKAEDIALDIVYQDNDLIVVNKAVGMVTHPGAGITSGTLVNALMYHCGDSLSGISGVLRPGIVHRLDKDTSGLLVVAKNDRAHHSLAQQIKDKTARRQYLALLEGTLPDEQGLVDKPIGRHPVDRKKMAIVESGRQARTHYQQLRHWHKFSLIEATLETGRTHQIRVHMASLNCPVVGDIVYNRKTTGSLEARRRLGLNGHALHAARLQFNHPTTGELREFTAALPVEFQALLDKMDDA
jgi:23S rRNA pseudouridine1911/1915/1917 synthase